MSYFALIVDDDRWNAEILARVLESHDVGALVITNPLELVKLLQSDANFHVIFMDLEMPGLTGYQALELIRQKLGPTVPVIAHTVHLNEAVLAAQYGFDGFIAKPLDTDCFPGYLHRILFGEPVWVTR